MAPSSRTCPAVFAGRCEHQNAALAGPALTLTLPRDFRYQDAAVDTLRTTQGHLARSVSNPAAVVRDGEHWASLGLT